MTGIINFLRFLAITAASFFIAYIVPSPAFLASSFAREQWWIPLLLKLIVIEIALLILIPKKRKKVEPKT
jgi:uncharacterized membrane protein YhhN